MKVPAFADIGKQANDLLYGAGSKGKFQYDSKVTLNMKSVEGVVGTAKAVKSGDSVSTDFTLKYSHVFNKNVLTLEGEPAMKKIQATLANQAIEGLKVQLAASVPNSTKTAKLTTEYAQPYLNSKAVVTLKEQSPLVNVAAATGYNGFVLGGTADIDARNSKLNGVKLAAAYMGADFAVTAQTDAQLKAVTGTYWQQLDAASTVATEVKHDTESKQVALNMGYCHFAPATGNMYKVKFGTEGNVSLHYETKMRPDTTVAVSALLNALNLSQDPKIGIAIDHSP